MKSIGTDMKWRYLFTEKTVCWVLGLAGRYADPTVSPVRPVPRDAGC